MTEPGLTLLPGAGCGSNTQGERPVAVALGAGVGGVVGCAAGCTVGADVGSSLAAVGAGAAVAAAVASGLATTVGAGHGVGAGSSVSSSVGRLLSGGIAEVACPKAPSRVPMADQNRLPNKRMQTMPTIVAIIRPGEPSSGGRRFTNRH